MAGYCNDFYKFNNPAQTWTNLTNLVKGSPPSPRANHAITSSDDGKIYVFGGFTFAGEGTYKDTDPKYIIVTISSTMVFHST